MADENTVWLKADGKSDKAAKAFRIANDEHSQTKDALKAAKREETDATRALDEAQEADDAEKHAKVCFCSHIVLSHCALTLFLTHSGSHSLPHTALQSSRERECNSTGGSHCI